MQLNFAQHFLWKNLKHILLKGQFVHNSPREFRWKALTESKKDYLIEPEKMRITYLLPPVQQV